MRLYFSHNGTLDSFAPKQTQLKNWKGRGKHRSWVDTLYGHTWCLEKAEGDGIRNILDYSCNGHQWWQNIPITSLVTTPNILHNYVSMSNIGIEHTLCGIYVWPVPTSYFNYCVSSLNNMIIHRKTLYCTKKRAGLDTCIIPRPPVNKACWVPSIAPFAHGNNGISV